MSEQEDYPPWAVDLLKRLHGDDWSPPRDKADTDTAAVWNPFD